MRWRWAGGALLTLAAAAMAHPKPGAHADVRISIADDAVRVHVMMNIQFVDQIVNVPRRAALEVLESEEDALRGALLEYFGGSRAGGMTALVDRANSVSLDGLLVAPVMRELRVIPPEIETRPGFVQNPALRYARVYATIEYPCKAAPRRVSVVWGAYPRDFAAADRDLAPITDIEAVLTARGRMELVTFRKAEPEFTWHAPVSEAGFAPAPRVEEPRGPGLPLVSIAVGVCGVAWALGRVARGRTAVRPLAVGGIAFGAVAAMAWPLRSEGSGSGGAISEGAVLEAFRVLHANLYRAFDYERECDVYDALAQSVDGPLLDRVYGEVYHGLVMQEEGGAVARVRAVEALATRVVPAPDGEGFGVSCRWRVEGVVYHWGHSHSRTSEYEAEFGMADRNGAWRIVSMRPMLQQRLEPAAQAASEAAVGRPAPAADAGSATSWHPSR